MPEIRSTLLLDQDGVTLPDLPAVLRYLFPVSAGPFTIEAAPDNNSSTYHALSQPLANPAWLYIATDQPINLKFNDGSDVFALGAPGSILFQNVSLSSAPLISYNNPAATGGNTANITILLFGNS